MASFQNISAITLASLFSVFVNGCPQPPKTYVRPSATNGGEDDPAIRAIEATGGSCFRYEELKGLLVKRDRYWLKETEGNPVVSICVDNCSTPKQLVDDIAKFKHLQSLCIQKTALTDKQAAVIAGMPDITSLRLENTSLTDKGISELAKLKLYGTSVTVEGLKNVAASKSLRHVDVTNTKITHAQCRRFNQTSDQCRATIVDD